MKNTSLTHPHLDWLRRRWQLPADALPAIEGLLESEAAGGTAVRVENPPSHWSQWGPGVEFAAEADVSNGTAGESATPLVVQETPEGVFWQSRALFQAERAVAAKLLALAAQPSNPPENLDAALRALFPEATLDNRQVAATRMAATRHLALITGGPGTGKTYTLARILAVLSRQSDFSPTKIRLAAPTGKAAQRMREAIGEALHQLPAEFGGEALALTAENCTTLHSLLGYNPSTGRCRDRMLPPDVTVILDECSMIDLPLWDTLLRLLPTEARLILLGDPCQLESVGQGAVLMELATAPSLSDHRIHLTESHRFRDCPGLKNLAAAMLEGDAPRACTLLESAQTGSAHATHSPESAGLLWLPKAPERMEDFPAFIRDAHWAIATAPTPEAALEALSKACILTAHRQTRLGSLALSQRIENHLRQDEKARFFPIIIDRNDAETGLSNGTLGVVERSPSSGPTAPQQEKPDSGSRAHFYLGGKRQTFPLARLPEYSPAGAITIHRSQGSEYERVMVVLPRGESPLATRELLYTAITRARRLVAVCGELKDVRQAVANQARRCTLLKYALQT